MKEERKKERKRERESLVMILPSLHDIRRYSNTLNGDPVILFKTYFL